MLESRQNPNDLQTTCCIWLLQSDPELTTMEGAPALAMTVWQPTPAVQQATATGAYPALTSLAEVRRCPSPAWHTRYCFMPRRPTGMEMEVCARVASLQCSLLVTSYSPSCCRWVSPDALSVHVCTMRRCSRPNRRRRCASR